RLNGFSNLSLASDPVAIHSPWNLRCARNDEVRAIAPAIASPERVAMHFALQREPAIYRQDNPASIVVQKPQCSGAAIGAPAWASKSRIAMVKTTSAEENRKKRFIMMNGV
ncbi:hypothetical protein, partial [Bradyrhizobium sp. UFLA05-112]